MEMILGVIEDLLDKIENGNTEEKEDSKHELKINFDQFKVNLKSLADSGNVDAGGILSRLENVSF